MGEGEWVRGSEGVRERFGEGVLEGVVEIQYFI